MIPPTLSDLAVVLAQQAPTSRPANPGLVEFFRSPMSLMMVLIVVLWIFVIRSKRRDAKQKKDLLSNIKRGDRIQTIGGILGKVVDAEESKVLVKVDESSNTKIWFSRNAIHRVLEEEAGDVKK